MKGKLVVIKNDHHRVVYEVMDEYETKLVLRGITYRVVRVVAVEEVIEATEEDVAKEIEYAEKYYNKLQGVHIRNNKKYILGTILHLDGDEKYLKKCMELYDSLDIFAYGVRIDEAKMPEEIEGLLKQITPDIIVITGHDSYNSKGISDLSNYKNTVNFMETVKKIRRWNTTCCIIAGACQSHFEALMASGATFASSPKRVNIHTFDPAVIAIKVATTSFMKVVDFTSIIKYIEDGRDAYGGVEALGKMKMLL